MNIDTFKIEWNENQGTFEVTRNDSKEVLFESTIGKECVDWVLDVRIEIIDHTTYFVSNMNNGKFAFHSARGSFGYVTASSVDEAIEIIKFNNQAIKEAQANE